MNASLSASRDFLALSRRMLDELGPDGLGSESDQRHFTVDGVEPTWVAMPATEREAERCLRLCREHDLSVVPAGKGLRLGQGMPAERVDVVLSTERMSSIVEHAAADLTLTVEAGATLEAVDAALRPAQQWLPFDPPRPAETTVGGLIAARAAGPLRQSFGTPGESLIGIRALLADGTAVKSGGRVVKNVAGYDLQELLVGSFGTLALIVEATFKLQPRPEARRLVGFAGPGLVALAHAAAALADSVLGPHLLELLVGADRATTLVAGFGGVAEEVAEAARRAVELAAGSGARPTDDPIDEAGLGARLEAIGRAGHEVIVARAAVRRDALAPWLGVALEQCRHAAERVSAQAHAGIGVARLRLDGARLDDVAERLPALRHTARRAGGYLVLESVPAAWKTRLDVWGPPPAGFELMRGAKAAFDPERRLSPGRFVGRL